MGSRMPTFANEPAEALAFFQEHGYQIEPNVFPAAEREQLIRASENLPAFKDGTYAITMNPHHLDPVFLRALRNVRLVTIIERLLGGRVSGIQTQFFLCKPGTPGFARHQDNFYVEAKREVFASAWSPLVDVSRANGTMVIYPGSHKEGILPVETVPGQPANLDANALRQQAMVPAKYQPMDVIANAGETVFIHGHLVHSSYQNGSQDFRRVLLCTYIRTGEKFRPGFNARRTEVDVYSQDPLPLAETRL